MNWRRRRRRSRGTAGKGEGIRRRKSNSPPGTGGVSRSDGVVDGSNKSPLHSFIGFKENYFDLTTTPASGHPSCSRRGVVAPLLQFIHNLIDLSHGETPDSEDDTFSSAIRNDGSSPSR